MAKPALCRAAACIIAPVKIAAALLVAWSCLLPPTLAAEELEAALRIGGRTIHVFRAPVGMFTPEERREAARARIEQVLDQPGEGWTSVKPTVQGIEVSLDGKPMFLVVAGDARRTVGEAAEDLANAAARSLQKVWSEARERREPRANLEGLLNVALATVLLAAATALALAASRRLRQGAYRRLGARLRAAPFGANGGRLAELLPTMVSRLILLATWLLGLFVAFAYLSYSLGQFALTRPASESLSHAIRDLAIEALDAGVGAVPNLFIAAFIFLIAWVATRISGQLFDSVRDWSEDSAFINTHTAPATRRIVNASLWLFAVAMAYPYLPGSHTEAFKGLSVIVGLMASVGAAGVVGQVASGMMIVYTYALREGEYVRIAEHEGVVVEIGLFVTRLRSGMGEEIALPNAYVLSNVTRNFSRAGAGGGHMIDATVTIGYDAAWRQVHALLLEAAAAVPEIRAEPAPYVVQTALSDFYVAYRLVAQIDAGPASRARVLSRLHAAIQDAFNRAGVQIMSPHYHGDPAAPKIAPPAA